ncbi:MAG: porin family protein [Candidatus Zixiibacteriota bacterium]
MLWIIGIVLSPSFLAFGRDKARVEIGFKGGTFWAVGSRSGNMNADPCIRGLWSGGGGATITLPIGRAVAVQSEVMYLKKKIELFPPSPGIALDRFSFGVLEIPLLLKISPNSVGDRMTVSFYTGGYVGLKLSARVNQTWHDNDDYNGDFDIVNSTKGADYGLAGGFELARRCGKGKVTLDIRYDLGLVNIRPKSLTYLQGFPVWVQNIRGLGIMLGYRFEIR